MKKKVVKPKEHKMGKSPESNNTHQQNSASSSSVTDLFKQIENNRKFAL